MIGKGQETTLYAEGVISFKGKIRVPQVDDLIQKLLVERYRNLKKIYWWSGMKKDIMEFVAKCQNCQQVEYEHQRHVGSLQRMSIPDGNGREYP